MFALFYIFRENRFYENRHVCKYYIFLIYDAIRMEYIEVIWITLPPGDNYADRRDVKKTSVAVDY